ncbi:hypothetical protein MF406_06230 [Georgenia sp. TF02-10]|uniref:hypothetical protein n=1 Tax=Georgenia sp. TF02-10 TaxID=2917725 RepID=UPI001FA713AA|nr:hypothetical protein [Georgenia sp. TF02-10]UNX55830.1 hypothetical protein MF406_06230 [Georgenia sp. TF02-10]
MSWEALLEDLQSQFDAALRTEDDELVVELTEAEVGAVHLADRVRARLGEELVVRLRTGTHVRGRLLDAAPQWLLLDDDGRRVLVPLDAVATVSPLGAAAPDPGDAERRLRVTHVLRMLARQGTRLRVTSEAGDYVGWVVRVGADHLDLRTDRDGEVLSLALSAVLMVSHP